MKGELRVDARGRNAVPQIQCSCGRGCFAGYRVGGGGRLSWTGCDSYSVEEEQTAALTRVFRSRRLYRCGVHGSGEFVLTSENARE